ncbi:DUF885 domain-containing protein [Brevundimonas aveniformis]|uniref:DUF885 domain-containing protein n=1 Tax=Brevundimonas aveniformis TaxID=370977 RepID=UPI0004074EFA|nr:DUF885 domain-containing protein [Brevundimonas aveniformis]
MFDRRSVLLGLALSAAAPAALARTAFQDGPAAGPDADLVEALDAAFMEAARTSPETLTGLGLKERYGELDDYTPGGAAANLLLAAAQASDIVGRFENADLSEQGQLSLRLLAEGVVQQRALYRYRQHQYLITKSGSVMSALPVMLMNQHRVDDVSDARAYISRLTAVERVMREVAADFRDRAAAGFAPPALTYQPNLTTGRAIISGAPFEEGAESPLWTDIQAKVNALDIPDGEKVEILGDARAALTGPFKAGYEVFLAAIAEVGEGRTANDGVWALPDGAAYYEAMLGFYNSTDDTADWIHETGLAEVARLRGEMEVIKDRVGFDGDLQAFFEHLRTDPQFQYPNTPEGKEAFLEDSRRYIAQAMDIAPQWFHTLPQAPLEVRAVETWREQTASTAFYNQPSQDGTRPGIYYVNLADMTQVSKPSAEGIAYHEGAPGHHFQIARAMEQPGLPMFRKYGFYGAYAEGWGLYAEKLGKEMGFYQDPYSDFGRLTMEIWRAIRMVVDTGIHTRRWTREQAVQYFTENSMVAPLTIDREIDRYICSPGQATSYKVGMLKILALRAAARERMGDRFDIKDFHEVVLGVGAVPLGVLQERVEAWAAE